jgi:hypothetical protein
MTRADRDERLAYFAAWRAANRERCREHDRRWRAANIDEIRRKDRKRDAIRRARARGAIVVPATLTLSGTGALWVSAYARYSRPAALRGAGALTVAVSVIPAPRPAPATKASRVTPWALITWNGPSLVAEMTFHASRADAESWLPDDRTPSTIVNTARTPRRPRRSVDEILQPIPQQQDTIRWTRSDEP